MQRRQWLVGMGCAAWSPWARPIAPIGLRVVAGEQSTAQLQVLEALYQRFPALRTPVPSGPPRGKRELVLAVGPAGLRKAAKEEDGAHILSLFTSGPSFHEMMGTLPGEVRSRFTAIFAEPSPAQQIQLIDKLFGKRVVVGVLFGSTTAYLEPLVQRAAQTAKLQLRIARHDAGGAGRLLPDLGADVLLALPDRDLYNAGSLHDILETCYRRNLPLVGYSAGLANAGATACAYASMTDVLWHAVEMVDDIALKGTLPEPQFPRYWRVAVNDHVARSLNLVIDDAVRALGHQPSSEAR